MAYTPHTENEVKEMLKTIGAESVEDLFRSIPKEMRTAKGLNLPCGMGEQGVLSHMTRLSEKNATLSSRASFLGAGAYRHYVPAAVSEIASRSEFVTPYTPYQPEISQGTLQAIFEYQTEICRLFDMDVSNASHYSGATACADAALMARRAGRSRKKIVTFDSLHPEYRAVLSTYLCGKGDLVTIPSDNGLADREALKSKIGADTAVVIVSYPNFFGIVEDLREISDAAHEAGALFMVVVPEPIALGLLNPPGHFGADIAVGEGLSLGLGTNFGGPTLGILTVKSTLVRQIPGRVCGRTMDADGRMGYVLTLSTREQHIRREKATSNICSNQALCATTAAIYMSLLGKAGIRELAEINAGLAAYARESFSKINGVTLPYAAPTFNEFVINTKIPAAELLAQLAAKNIFGGVDLGNFYPEMKDSILVCVTELNTKDEIDNYALVLQGAQ